MTKLKFNISGETRTMTVLIKSGVDVNAVNKHNESGWSGSKITRLANPRKELKYLDFEVIQNFDVLI